MRKSSNSSCSGPANSTRTCEVSRLGSGLGGVGAVVHPIKTRQEGDLAFNVGTFEVRQKGEDEIARSGTYTFIFERQPDGTWAIAHHSWARDAPPD